MVQVPSIAVSTPRPEGNNVTSAPLTGLPPASVTVPVRVPAGVLAQGVTVKVASSQRLVAQPAPSSRRATTVGSGWARVGIGGPTAVQTQCRERQSLFAGFRLTTRDEGPPGACASWH